MFAQLMRTRRFAPLFWCQFFSAFNDNFLKNALVFLILFKIAGSGAESLITLAGGIFIAPFFFLSGVGGQMADRYDKAFVAQRLKLFEIGAAVLAVVGFLLHSLPILFAALFAFGVIAALFGPIKYGILPDHLARHELPAGNALVEAATFIAILLGTIAGGLAARDGGDPGLFGLLVVVFAVLCWGSSLLIPSTLEAAPNLRVDVNILRSTAALLRDLRRDPRLWRGAIVISWFWLVGAVMLSLLPPLAKNRLGGNEEVVTLLLAMFSVGVGLGSALASWLANGRIILLPTAVGAVLMGVSGLDLAWAVSSAPPALPIPNAGIGAGEFLRTGIGLRAALDFAGLAIGGGLFVVPIFTAVQIWAGADRRARVVAAVNVLNAAFMTVSALVVAALQGAGVSIPILVAALSIGNLVAAVWIVRTQPTNPLRDLATILFRIFYRVEVHGAENLAKAGPRAVITANHVSFLDPTLVWSLLEREPVFAIDQTVAKLWWVKPFARLTKALPLDPTRPMATRTLIDAVKSGETLIIFPEGRITVTGSLMKVYDGTALIADKAEAPVVPVRIEGLEHTFFSRLESDQIRRRWFPKVTVTVLEPVKLDVAPELVGRRRRLAAGTALSRVMSDLIFRTTSIERTIMEALIEAAKQQGARRHALEDPVGGALSYKRLLLGVSVLGRKLMPLAPEGRAIGVMLPNANGAAVTLLAVMSGGRVPAMINFTAGAANILSGCTAAQVNTILTSRAFVEKGRLEKLIETLSAKLRIIYLEDVRASVGALDKIRGLLGWRKPLVPRRPDDPAAILFTSGSEGVPKGVVLSSRNILANVAQAKARIDFGRRDKVFMVLPVFHSFGLTVGLILPLVSGVQVYLYPSPLHYRTIPELIYGVNATVLMGTDTFLAGYARAANAYDFRSLRIVLAGAEPVKEATRRVWMEKFGLRILEGYGITETAPAVSMNTPMFNRFGTVGVLFPGMEARLEPVPGVEGAGRLHLRGPNVMLGYLRAERPGVLESPAEGWHDTGDIVAIDPEGFIAIKGRAKRFAKIGGEMISLAAVEALAAELWPDALSVAAAVPDPRKGERVVLLTQKASASRAEFQAFAKERHAPELITPGAVAVVEHLPLLGSGKVDYAAATRLARERFGGGEASAAA